MWYEAVLGCPLLFFFTGKISPKKKKKIKNSPNEVILEIVHKGKKK
jgi:hypothetical protein